MKVEHTTTIYNDLGYKLNINDEIIVNGKKVIFLSANTEAIKFLEISTKKEKYINYKQIKTLL